jgi:hypothetical protein
MLLRRANVDCASGRGYWSTRRVPATGRNPDQHTHTECDAHGYRNIKPLMSRNLPPISAGEVHQFRAVLRRTTLSLTADGNLVWEGDVGDEVLRFDGPVGLRTDNARFELEFFAGAPESAAGARFNVNRCEQRVEG